MPNAFEITGEGEVTAGLALVYTRRRYRLLLGGGAAAPFADAPRRPPVVRVPEPRVLVADVTHRRKLIDDPDPEPGVALVLVRTNVGYRRFAHGFVTPLAGNPETKLYGECAYKWNKRTVQITELATHDISEWASGSEATGEIVNGAPVIRRGVIDHIAGGFLEVVRVKERGGRRHYMRWRPSDESR
jgi:hypothetical protein